MPAAVKRQALHSTAECEAVGSNATDVNYRVCVLCFGARSLRFNQMSLRCFVAKTAPSACQGCLLQILLGQQSNNEANDVLRQHDCSKIDVN